jgi:hypothetical protein
MSQRVGTTGQPPDNGIGRLEAERLVVIGDFRRTNSGIKQRPNSQTT